MKKTKRNRSIFRTALPAILFSALLAGCSSTPSEEIANPWQKAENAAQAEEIAGFDFEFPASIKSCPDIVYQVLDDDSDPIVEAVYDGPDNSITIRKAPGDEDISGYSADGKPAETTIDGHKLTLKSENDLINAVTWSENGYSYSITSDAGLSFDEVKSLVQQIK